MMSDFYSWNTDKYSNYNYDNGYGLIDRLPMQMGEVTATTDADKKSQDIIAEIRSTIIEATEKLIKDSK